MTTNLPTLTPGKKAILGFQHLFAMFGATVLVPTALGLNVGVALVCAGLGTLLFHFITGHKVPVFLGSSFAYIGACKIALDQYGLGAMQGGIIAAGLVYVILSLVVKLIGPDRIKKLFPPVVTGPIIVVIGINLAPTGIGDASQNWLISGIVILTIIAVSVFARGFFKLVPVLIGLLVGYLVCLGCDLFGAFSQPLINMQVIADAPVINEFWNFGKFFTLPTFNWSAILLLAPVAFVTFMEHIGDITTNGSVVGKDFFNDPGLHRTLLGDGIATMVAGCLGGPANTTYSENTGVLATTKVYDTSVLKIAACYAIVLGLVGKFSAVLQTIPDAVKGGLEVVLFGMIAAIGMRTLVEAQLDFTHSRNLLIVALILVFGLGLSGGVAVTETFVISGLFIATVVGVLANAILPKEV